jgi:predicted acyl esterase
VGGHWRNEQEWLQRARPTTFYLQAGGGLSTGKPKASAPTHYQFDPKDPVPTIGGNISSAGNLMFRVHMISTAGRICSFAKTNDHWLRATTCWCS